MDKLRLDLDFSKDPIAQDMICRIMRDKGFQTPQEAVQYGVNSDTATDIIENRELTRQFSSLKKIPKSQSPE